MANGFVALQNDGKLVCSANGRTFVLDDLARTFVTASTTQTVSYGSEQIVPLSVSSSTLDESLMDRTNSNSQVDFFCVFEAKPHGV